MRKILIVDDVEINRMVLGHMFDKLEAIYAENGQEALDILAEHHEEIEVILLDLVMPVMDGQTFLIERQNYPEYLRIPVVIITGEDRTKELEKAAFNYDIADFIRKPFERNIVDKRVGNLIKLREYERSLEDKIAKQNEELLAINASLIESISNIVESRNMESGMHVKRVKTFVSIICNYLMEKHPELALTKQQAEMYVVTSAMHDIGKIVIGDAILTKPGKLTDDEFAYMKKHTVFGGQIIQESVEFRDSEYLRCAYDVAMYHHERWDGKGYPLKLSGEEIPLAAQITGVADVFDALVSERCYKPAYDYETAFKMILNNECGVFSPLMMEAFSACKDQFFETAQTMVAGA